MPRVFAYAAFMTAILLFGFGCKKDQPAARTLEPIPSPTAAKTGSPVIRTPATSTTPSSQITKPAALSPDVMYLRQVLRNLVQTRSFRASLSLPTDQGHSSGTIEYVKNIGLHGILYLPNQITSEVYLIGESVFFRTGTSTWMDLGSKPEGAQAARLFRSSFSLNEESINAAIGNTTKVINVATDPSGCRAHTLSQRTFEGTDQTSVLCVKNDLPTKITSAGQYGPIEVRYYDFNANIPLIAPVK